MDIVNYFTVIFCFAATTSSTALFSQEFNYEKECQKIDEYIYSGDFNGGINYLKHRISSYDSLNVVPNSSYSFFKMELGKLYYYTGEYKLAKKIILESINIDKSLKGENSNDYISGLSTLLELYREMGLYEKSLSVGKQILSLYDQVEITDSINYAFFLNNIGALYLSIGNISNAEKYLNEAKVQYYKLFNENHPNRLFILNNLGSLYKKKGQYAKTEQAYLRTLEIKIANYGKQHITIALSQNNLGDLYMKIGNISMAEKQFILAKSIYEFNNIKKLGYVYILTNLAGIYLRKNDVSEADQLCNMALSIADTLVEKNHKIYTSILSRLSNIYNYKKEYRRVITTLSESTRILKISNPNHIGLVSQYNLMGWAYNSMKEYDSAEIKFKEAMGIAELNYEKSHKNYVRSLNSLALVLYKQNKDSASKSLFIESMELLHQNIFQNFDFMSSSEKQKYLSVLKGNNHRFNSFAIDYYKQCKKISGEMFDYNLFLKGLILTSSERVKEFGVKNSFNDDLNKTYNEWINTKEYLAKVYTLPKSEVEKRKINTDSIENIANSLEKRLAEQSAVFEKQFVKEPYSWQNIRADLKKDEAFVQIVRFPISDSVIYAALIISDNKEEYPRLIVLNDGQGLENDHYKNYIENINRGYISNEIYDDTVSYLNYWGKIEKFLSGKRRVFLIPDGIYNKINIAALLMANEKFVYEIHDIVLLTSIHDFIDKKEVINLNNNNAVLIGAPDFFHNTKSDTILVFNNPDKSNSLYNYSNLRSGNLTPLPLSGHEVRYVDSILSEFNWKTELFTDVNATENVVKSLSSPEILHISTHGFYTDLEPQLENPGRELSLNNDFVTAIDPLFCSGLYFAGAQNSLDGKYIFDGYSEDGILTAFEVTNLNLDSTKLVVLSACETGLGDILNGEGVFGLQRAFMIAGAENIIMSLWKVDDRATQLFMKKFYTSWLLGNSKSDAFSEAINFLRFNTLDYTHPFYWGGFVLLGNEQTQNKQVNIFVFVIPLVLVIILVLIYLKRQRF